MTDSTVGYVEPGVASHGTHVTFEPAADIITAYLPRLMRDEDIPTLITRECSVCPPSFSLKCTHYDGMYVVMHHVKDDFAYESKFVEADDRFTTTQTAHLSIYVCAGHDARMRTTLQPTGSHATEIIHPCDTDTELAEEFYAELVESLLHGTLTEELAGIDTEGAYNTPT